VVVARDAHRNFIDQPGIVNDGCNARLCELISREQYWGSYDKGEPSRDMIGKLFGGGRRDERLAKEIHQLGPKEVEARSRK
jgi:hypothetical protein